MTEAALRILHVSDLHFGKPCRPDVIDATEAHVHQARYDVVAISGDVAQRSLSGEFQRAAVFIREASKVSQVIIVPGNHDVAWWTSPMHVLGTEPLYRRYRRHISADLEPVLRVPGAVFVGVNTSHGVARYTLTTRPRDVSIIGAVQPSQLDRVSTMCAQTAPTDLRVVVMHHNPVLGQLSNRYGIKHAARILDSYAANGVDLVLCGHDHQEALNPLSFGAHQMLVCTAGTLSDRSRGGRASSLFAITATASSLHVETHAWLDDAHRFEVSAPQCFARSSRA